MGVLEAQLGMLGFVPLVELVPKLVHGGRIQVALGSAQLNIEKEIKLERGRRIKYIRTGQEAGTNPLLQWDCRFWSCYWLCYLATGYLAVVWGCFSVHHFDFLNSLSTFSAPETSTYIPRG